MQVNVMPVVLSTLRLRRSYRYAAGNMDSPSRQVGLSTLRLRRSYRYSYFLRS
jgi:hypothetical protein